MSDILSWILQSFKCLCFSFWCSGYDKLNADLLIPSLVSYVLPKTFNLIWIICIIPFSKHGWDNYEIQELNGFKQSELIQRARKTKIERRHSRDDDHDDDDDDDDILARRQTASPRRC